MTSIRGKAFLRRSAINRSFLVNYSVDFFAK